MLTDGIITLRRFGEADVEPMALLANNRKIWDNVRNYFPYPYTTAEAASFIGMTQKEVPALNFAIAFEGVFCGVIGLVPLQDVYYKTSEMGYWIGEPFWGRGITVCAVRLISHYGLHELGFNRLHSGVFDFNVASMRVLEKSGYQKEGISRKAVVKNGVVCDEHRYALVK